MGLLNTLKMVKEGGFDPKKDDVQQSTRLPQGTYPVRLKSAERDVTKNQQQEQVVIELEVVSGEFKDRTEKIFLGFDDSLPEFVRERNGRTLLKLAEFAKVKFTNKDLADEEGTALALKKGIGNQFMLKLTITENKKNPQYPYRNHDFAALENGPFDGENISVEEDNLPF